MQVLWLVPLIATCTLIYGLLSIQDVRIVDSNPTVQFTRSDKPTPIRPKTGCVGRDPQTLKQRWLCCPTYAGIMFFIEHLEVDECEAIVLLERFVEFTGGRRPSYERRVQYYKSQGGIIRTYKGNQTMQLSVLAQLDRCTDFYLSLGNNDDYAYLYGVSDYLWIRIPPQAFLDRMPKDGRFANLTKKVSKLMRIQRNVTLAKR